MSNYIKRKTATKTVATICFYISILLIGFSSLFLYSSFPIFTTFVVNLYYKFVPFFPDITKINLEKAVPIYSPEIVYLWEITRVVVQFEVFIITIAMFPVFYYFARGVYLPIKLTNYMMSGLIVLFFVGLYILYLDTSIFMNPEISIFFRLNGLGIFTYILAGLYVFIVSMSFVIIRFSRMDGS